MCVVCWTHAIQVFAARATRFNADEFAEKFDNVQKYHQEQHAMRRLIGEVRRVLVERSEYEGSKIEMLDAYHAKLTELSTVPIVLRPGVHDVGAKEAPSSIGPKPAPKPRRNGRPKKPKTDGN